LLAKVRDAPYRSIPGKLWHNDPGSECTAAGICESIASGLQRLDVSNKEGNSKSGGPNEWSALLALYNHNLSKPRKLFYTVRIGIIDIQAIPPQGPRIRRANWISFCIIVTRFACIAHKLLDAHVKQMIFRFESSMAGNSRIFKQMDKKGLGGFLQR
jgi:hypothetical protein